MRRLAPLLLLFACQSPTPAWNAPAEDGPVLCGTVTDPQGRALADVEVRSYSGLATRFPGTATRTDAHGRYRIHPVLGSPIFDSSDGSDLFVGVCVGSVRSAANPAEFLPWKDVRMSSRDGTVVVLDFVFDPASVPLEAPGG